jgi:hypothetical protein
MGFHRVPDDGPGSNRIGPVMLDSQNNGGRRPFDEDLT